MKIYGVASMMKGTRAMSVATIAEGLATRRDDEEMKTLEMRLLLSYFYFGKQELDEHIPQYLHSPYPDMFCDSGAYSALTLKSPIRVQDYIAWLKRNRHWFSVYANLDVIGDPEGTLRNQMTMEDAGLTPIPVFHGGSDWSYLERYIEHYPYIALGGIVGKNATPFLIKCLKMAQGKSVFHAFGNTSWEMFLDLPFYSSDSSTWGAVFRFGTLTLFDDIKGGIAYVKLGHPKDVYRHAALLRRYGADPKLLAESSKPDRALVSGLAAKAYMLAERWANRRHGPIAIPTRPDAPTGKRLYLVDGTMTNFRNMQQGWDRLDGTHV
jgi:hypothetical protein